MALHQLISAANRRLAGLAIVGIFTATIAGTGNANLQRVEIGQFSSGSANGWESQTFVGETDYEILNDGDKTVLSARSIGSASRLGREVEIDLTKTPYVNWSWKIERGLGQVNEKSKHGDDFAARLYVVKSGGALGWKNKALTYVWSSSQARGESWPNPHKPNNAIMMAARGVDDLTGGWVTEKRNVREDLEAVYGKDITSIDIVAIMTDTDNTGKTAWASYGDIYFTAD